MFKTIKIEVCMLSFSGFNVGTWPDNYSFSLYHVSYTIDKNTGDEDKAKAIRDEFRNTINDAYKNLCGYTVDTSFYIYFPGSICDVEGAITGIFKEITNRIYPSGPTVIKYDICQCSLNQIPINKVYPSDSCSNVSDQSIFPFPELRWPNRI